MPVLLKVSAVFGVDVQVLLRGRGGRLIVDVREALYTAAPEEAVSSAELRQLTISVPTIGAGEEPLRGVTDA